MNSNMSLSNNKTRITYTNDDKINAHKFADTNYKIRILQAMYNKRPNIISQLKINIRDATQDDYYLPRTLVGRAKVMTIEMTEKCCKMLSCNPMRELEPCREHDDASWYYVGDSQFDVQCQPACFNTATNQIYDKTKTRTPDTPLLNWHNDACRIVNSQIQSWEEKPFYRSEIRFEKRLNDLPTGFSRIKDDNPFGCGYTYKNNATYCDYYELGYNKDEDTCETSLLDKILGAVVGSSLLQNLKGGIKAAVNGGDILTIPSNVPKKPTNVPIKLIDWQNDINKSFEIPNIIDYTKSSSANNQQHRRKKRSLTINDDHPRQLLEDAQHTKAKYSDYTKTILNIPITNTDDNDDAYDNPVSTTPDINKLTQIWENIFGFLTDPESLASIGIDLAANKALDKLKSLLVKLAERMSTALSKTLLKIPGSLGLHVLETAVQNVTLKILSASALRIGAQLTLFLAKMLTAAASVVGWLLMAAFIFDLIFTFWDPLGYNNLFPPTLPKDTMYNGELALRQALGNATADYNWEQLIKLLLSEDEILLISLESMLDEILYLDSLVVNSEGSVIDKGDHITFNNTDVNKIQESSNVAIARRNKFSLSKFTNYNDKFYKRAKINSSIHKIGYLLAFISGILLCTRLFLLSFICLLLALTLLCFFGFYSLNDDALINFIYNAPIDIVNSDNISSDSSGDDDKTYI